MVSPLKDCKAVFGTVIAAGVASVGMSAVMKEPGRHLQCGVVDRGDHAGSARVLIE